MSRQIFCPECNTANAPGSKFCNHCGSRLPPSTHLICPNCQTPNPRNRFYCDNCGTRLLRDDSTADPEEPKPASPAGRSGNVFSLPMRRPGQTAELDPSKLPDWLKTGETPVPGSEIDEWRGDTEEPPAQESDTDKKKLPSLEDLTSGRKKTDDLPDWLVNEDDPVPIITTPQPITTEYYQNLLKAQKDKEELQADEPVDAELPEWLSGQNLRDDAEVDEPEEDVLSGWLSDLSSPGDLQSAFTETTGDEADNSDWLMDPDSPTATEAEANLDFSQLPAEANDYFSNLDAVPEATAAAVSDWLTELDEFDNQALDEPDTVAADWDNLAEPDTAFEDPLPDWLATHPTDDEPLVGREQTAGGEPEGLFAAEGDADFLLDWLNEPTTSSEESPDTPAADELEEEETAEDLSVDREPDTPADVDWLTELELFDTDALAAEETVVDVSAEAEPARWPAPESDEPLPEVMLPFDTVEAEETVAEAGDLPGQVDDDWLSMDAVFEDMPLEEDLPDWLDQLGAPISGQEPPIPSHDESLAPSEDVPEWVAGLRPSPHQTGSSLPGVFSSSPLLPELDDISGELMDTELPDWLQGIPTDAAATATMSAPSQSIPDIPDWLQDSVGAESNVDSLLDTRGDEVTADMVSEWGAMLHDLPPASPPAQDLVKADIPEWIEALKPPELTGKAPSEPEEVEQQTGPLAGVRGVIDIEPVIAMPRTVAPLTQFVVTQEQQQQAALLRQLVYEEQQQATPLERQASGESSAWIRIFLALLLLATVLLGLLGPNRLPGTAASIPANVQEAHGAVQAAAGQPVLIAFEYTPAMAGELDAQAEMLLAHLETNGSPILTVSQYAAGTAVAAARVGNRPGQHLGFLPGDAVGLRRLGHCLSGSSPCETIFARPLSLELQQTLASVGLVIVLTGERENLVNWIEQVGSERVPLLAGVTQSLGPVAAPYVASGQLQGMIEGLGAAAAYQDAFQAGTPAPIRQRLNAQFLAQMLAAILLLVGGLYYSLAGLLSGRSQKRK